MEGVHPVQDERLPQKRVNHIRDSGISIFIDDPSHPCSPSSPSSPSSSSCMMGSLSPDTIITSKCPSCQGLVIFTMVDIITGDNIVTISDFCNRCHDFTYPVSVASQGDFYSHLQCGSSSFSSSFSSSTSSELTTASWPSQELAHQNVHDCIGTSIVFSISCAPGTFRNQGQTKCEPCPDPLTTGEQ
jgi:hypothetical protein